MAVSVLIIVCIGLYAVLFKNPPTPAISTQLEIGTGRLGSFKVHLRNRSYAVRSVRVFSKTRSSSTIEGENLVPRDIEPDGELTVPLLMHVKPEIRGMAIEVYYDAQQRGTVRHWVATHRFMWSAEAAVGTIINPHSSKIDEREWNPNLAIDEQLATFAKNTGSWSMVIPELAPDGSPNILECANAERRFIADMGSRIVRFEVRGKMGKTPGIHLPLGDSIEGYHTVVLRWNPTGFALTVDGKGDTSPGFVAISPPTAGPQR